MLWGLPLALVVHLTHPLYHFEKSRTATNAVGFQRRRHGKTDGFLSTADIGHHKVGGQRV
jgi:hypothetical protein